MAELNEKLLKVEALKKLGQKVHDDYATKTEVQQQIQEAQSSVILLIIFMIVSFLNCLHDRAIRKLYIQTPLCQQNYHPP